MSVGVGAKAAIGLGTETNYGESTAPSAYPVMTSESMDSVRELIKSGSLTGESMVTGVVPGVDTPAGGFEMNLDGLGVGTPIWLWNGDAGYSRAAAPGQITNAPTGSAAAGGTLAVGNYRYKVAAVLQWNGGGQPWLFICPASAESAQIASASSNNTINLAFTDPTGLTLPQGFTYYGTAIYRTQTDGAAHSERFLALQATTGASYADTGSVNTGATAASTKVPVYSGGGLSLNRHVFLGTTPGAGVERLDSFSMSILKDNDVSERFCGCRMGEFKFGAGGPNEIIKASFGITAQRVVEISNFSPVIVDLQPILGWKAAIAVDGGSADCNIKSFEITGNNNLEPDTGLCSVPYNKDVASTIRTVTGTITRGFVDHTFWRRVQNSQNFSLRISAWGQPILNQANAILTVAENGVAAIPFPYFFEVDLPICIGSKAGGPVAGQGRIIETINFECQKDPTLGSDMRIYLYNTQSAAYA